MALSLTHDDHISGTVDQLEDWASILYPEIPDGHWIVAWCKPADGSRARTIWAQTTKEAAEQAAPLVSTHHVYLSVGTRSEKTRGRGKREHVGQLVGFWCDIDTADGQHGAEGLPTRAEAIQAVERLTSAELEPSAIVDTGGGYHLYWLTTEPTSAQDSQKVYDEFGRNVSAYFGDQGIAVDPISADVARVMRWPGSLNHKMEPAPKVEHFTDGMKRYGTTTITTGFARLAPRPPVERPEPAGTPVSLPDGDRPGDWYNQHHDPGDLLANWWGWAEVPGESTSRYTAYKHPAATNTSSGGIYRDYDDGLPRFYSFTTSTELPAGRTFTAFDLYAFRQHNGDIPAAAKAIRREMMPKKDTAPMSTEQTRHLAPVHSGDAEEAKAAYLRPVPEVMESDDEHRARLKLEARHRFIAGDAILDLPAPEPMIGDWLDRGMIAVMPGKFGSGKSFLMLDMALSVASGVDWLGESIHHTGPVWYVMAEGAYTASKRVKAWTIRNGQSVPDNFLLYPHRFDLTDSGSWAGLRWILQDHLEDSEEPPALIVLDTYSQLTSGEEKPETTKAALEALYTIREASGASIVMATHTGHGVTGRTRGDSTLEDNIDVVLPIEGRLRDPVTGNLAPAQLQNSKQKNRDLHPPAWFKIHLLDDPDTGEALPYVDLTQDRPAIDNKGKLTKQQKWVKVWEYLRDNPGLTESKLRRQQESAMAEALDGISTRERWVIVGQMAKHECVRTDNSGAKGAEAAYAIEGAHPNDIGIF